MFHITQLLGIVHIQQICVSVMKTKFIKIPKKKKDINPNPTRVKGDLMAMWLGISCVYHGDITSKVHVLTETHGKISMHRPSEDVEKTPFVAALDLYIHHGVVRLHGDLGDLNMKKHHGSDDLPRRKPTRRQENCQQLVRLFRETKTLRPTWGMGMGRCENQVRFEMSTVS